MKIIKEIFPGLPKYRGNSYSFFEKNLVTRRGLQVLRVIRYLKGCPDLGLLLPRERSLDMIAYCDSDCGTCLMTRRSLTGFCVKLGGSLISWM